MVAAPSEKLRAQAPAKKGRLRNYDNFRKFYFILLSKPISKACVGAEPPQSDGSAKIWQEPDQKTMTSKRTYSI